MQCSHLGSFKRKMAKKSLIDKLEKFSKRHPFIFWGGSLLWVILPDPIPVIDEILVITMLSIVGIKKLK